MTKCVLPFKRGDQVVIPAGTKVKTMHPSRKEFVTKRRMTIKVNHTLDAMSMKVCMMTQRDRCYYPQFSNVYSEFDALCEMMREMTGDELKLAYRIYDDMRVQVSNPKICWPGSGGYWNEVDIDDILAANEKTAA